MPDNSPPLSRRISWRVEALAYDVVNFILNLFPFAWISTLGGFLLRKIGPFTSKHKIAETGLKIAFPEASEAQIHKLLDAQWDNIGRTFAEFPLLHRIKAFSGKRVEIVGLEIFKQHNPAIIITGHFANWEVMATVLTQSNSPVRITYRKINNPYIDARVRKKREAYGTQFLVQKSGHKGGRELFEALNNGESIAILNDQKFNTGYSIPFFGENAMTAQGATRLALKTGRPLLPMAITRNGAKFTVTFYDPIPLETTGDRENDVFNGVLKITQFIEARIREKPEQWFWVHRRWPKTLYKAHKN
ncbi:KDO2-lipid IV(A) lauroyltransferase [Litorimonas taeanensis]|uniref:KDO2-lipid IV(A) lauroyltransferase n=1 Tax=Litorimonas taeanensis TaxID=568099 RepID=A0A420WDL0_9PROT|nr:lysophospholipid acyltransferase family protein [Litorimonas taeanensis]RKQ69109.1 KDO2-lipid IV(A) lauroyltransferase [Litorimonas taeanensis]